MGPRRIKYRRLRHQQNLIRRQIRREVAARAEQILLEAKLLAKPKSLSKRKRSHKRPKPNVHFKSRPRVSEFTELPSVYGCINIKFGKNSLAKPLSIHSQMTLRKPNFQAKIDNRCRWLPVLSGPILQQFIPRTSVQTKVIRSKPLSYFEAPVPPNVQLEELENFKENYILTDSLMDALVYTFCRLTKTMWIPILRINPWNPPERIEVPFKEDLLFLVRKENCLLFVWWSQDTVYVYTFASGCLEGTDLSQLYEALSNGAEGRRAYPEIYLRKMYVQKESLRIPIFFFQVCKCLNRSCGTYKYWSSPTGLKQLALQLESL